MKRFLPVLIVLVVAFLAGGLLALKKGKPVETEREGGEEINLKLKMKNEKRVLMVLAPKDFRDEEYLEPRRVLEEAGLEVKVGSKGVNTATGTLEATASVDQDLGQVKVEDYDGIVFIGGPGSSVYFNDTQALALAKTAYEQGKVVGAICIAPSILANSGILKGKKATCFPSEAENLKARGANYTAALVEVDGRVVTASGPQAATK